MPQKKCSVSKTAKDLKTEGYGDIVSQIETFADLWLESTGSQDVANFYKALPATTRKAFQKEALIDVFKGRAMYNYVGAKTTIRQATAAGANIGNVASKKVGQSKTVIKANERKDRIPLSGLALDAMNKRAGTFFRISNEQGRGVTDAFIADENIEDVVDFYLSPTTDEHLPLGLRPHLAMSIIEALHAEAVKTETGSDRRKEIAEMEANVMVKFTLEGSQFARGLQAMGMMSKLTPEGTLMYVNRMVAAQANNALTIQQTRIANLKRARKEAMDEVGIDMFDLGSMFSVSKTLDSRKRELQRKREEALAVLKGKTSTLNMGVDPEKLKAAVKFGYYLVLEGAVTFKQWSSKFKQAYSKVTPSELLEIWNTRISGTPLAKLPLEVRRELMEAAGDPAALAKVLDKHYSPPTPKQIANDVAAALDGDTPLVDVLDILPGWKGYEKEIVESLKKARESSQEDFEQLVGEYDIYNRDDIREMASKLSDEYLAPLQQELQEVQDAREAQAAQPKKQSELNAQRKQRNERMRGAIKAEGDVLKKIDDEVKAERKAAMQERRKAEREIAAAKAKAKNLTDKAASDAAREIEKMERAAARDQAALDRKVAIVTARWAKQAAKVKQTLATYLAYHVLDGQINTISDVKKMVGMIGSETGLVNVTTSELIDSLNGGFFGIGIMDLVNHRNEFGTTSLFTTLLSDPQTQKKGLMEKDPITGLNRPVFKTNPTTGKKERVYVETKSDVHRAAWAIHSIYTAKVKAAIRTKGRQRWWELIGNKQEIEQELTNRNFNVKSLEDAVLRGMAINRTIPQDVQVRIAEMATAMYQSPFDFQKAKIAQEIYSEVINSMGSLNKMDVITSFWYASMLSRMGTHVVNAGGSASQLIFESLVNVIIPGRTGKVDFVKGIAKGMTHGGHVFMEILRGNINPDSTNAKFNNINVLEVKYTKKGWREQVKQIQESYAEMTEAARKDDYKGAVQGLTKLLHGGAKITPGSVGRGYRFIPRVLAATDQFFYWTAYHAKADQAAAIMAEKAAKSKGVEVSVLKSEFAGRMGSETMFRVQREALTKLQEAYPAKEIKITDQPQPKDPNVVHIRKKDVISGMYEAMDKARSEDVNIASDIFGTTVNYNRPPEGTIGAIATSVSALSQKVLPVRLVVPFTTIVANVINEQLNWTPVGAMRAAGWHMSRKAGSDGGWRSTAPKSPEQAQEMLTKSIIGFTAFVAGVAVMAQGGMGMGEDELPWFTAAGPSDWNKKRQLQERGWRPYSIRIGDSYWNYQFTPVSMVLAALGTISDHIKYEGRPNWNDQTGQEILKDIGWGLVFTGTGVFNMSFLSGLGAVFEGLTATNRNSTYRIEKAVDGALIRPLTAIFAGVAKDVDYLFQPVDSDPVTEWERIKKQVPFLRRTNEFPSRNSFGKVIDDRGSLNAVLGLSRFVTPSKIDDEVEQAFQDLDLYVPAVSGGTDMYMEREDPEYAGFVDKMKLNEDKVMAYRYRMLYGKAAYQHMKLNADEYSKVPKESIKANKKGARVVTTRQQVFKKNLDKLYRDRIRDGLTSGKTDIEIATSLGLEVDKYMGQ